MSACLVGLGVGVILEIMKDDLKYEVLFFFGVGGGILGVIS